MRWLKNMKVAGKLLIIVIPLFIIVFVLIGLIQFGLTTVDESMGKSLYDEAFVSTAAILNADRDLYQAAIAEKELVLGGSALTAERRNTLLKDYNENTAQAEERIFTALSNVSGNQALYSNTAHEATGLTLKELEQSIKKNFSDWKSLYDPKTGVGNIRAQEDVFDKAREEINVITEILESQAKASTVQMKQGLSSALNIFFIVVIFIIVALGILTAYIIISIRGSIKHVTEISRRIAQGDLSAEIDPKKLTKDEIGQLIFTVDNEVREAFKSIAEVQTINEKKNRYQGEQVDKLVVNLERLSSGELYCDMAAQEPDEDTKDLYELYSRISENLHLTVNTLKTYISEISGTLAAMSAGDFSVSIESDYCGEFVALKESINTIAESLSRMVSEINIAAEQVASGTRQVSDGSQEISQGATEQAGAIEELSATVTQIAAQTKQNAESAGSANALASEARNNAALGNDQMKSMQAAMSEINESSANISKIIKVIDDIAFQTNILALNAAVEAARAGVHGKGFAVVAEEVRNLAARSANAAKETTALIEGSIKKTMAGTGIANETARALEGIVSGVEKAADLMSRIAAASNEQTTGIAQINGGIEQLSQVVQTNSATAEETAAAAEELSSQAELLKQMVSRFTLGEKDTAPAPLKEQPASEAQPKKAGPRIVLNDKEYGKY